MYKNLVNKKRFDELSGLQLYQLIRYGSLLFISIILVKSGLGKEDFGRYELLILVAGAVSFFWLTGIIQSLLPLYGNNSSINTRNNSGEKSPEIFNSFILLFIFSVFAAGLILIIGSVGPGLVEEKFHPELVPFLAAFIVLQSPSVLIEYIYTLRKEAKKVIVYGVLSYGIQILAVGIPAILGMELKWILVGLTGSAFIRFIWLIILLGKVAKPQLSFPFIREHLKLGAPIMISVLLSGSATYIDGFIVTAYFDEDVFAVFRNGARELPLAALLAHALSSAIVPKFNELDLDQSLMMIRERSLSIIKWIFPLSFLLMIASYYLFPLVYNDDYFDSAGVFNLYLLLVITRLVFPQTILIGLKKTRVLVTASALELILNVGLSIILIRIWGIRGVAAATFIAYLLERVFLMAWIKTKLKISPSSYLNIKTHLFFSFILILLYLIVEFFIGEGISTSWLF